MTGGSGRRESGQLEHAVLTVLWAGQVAMTPAQTQRGLRDQGLDLAYTSVATTLTRLYAKGLVERAAQGRTYAYTPSGQAARDAAARMRALLGGGRARAVVLSHFVAGLDPDDEATLLELLGRAGSDPPDGADLAAAGASTGAVPAEGPAGARDSRPGEPDPGAAEAPGVTSAGG
jgi:predicted transcriptional regulator